jgi:HPt (histidine-containing phosphotransfer) domain-containing protein
MDLVHRFEELQERYAQALPQKAEELAAAWTAFSDDPADPAKRSALHLAVHRLSGSAPAYGFDQLGAVAQRVDTVFSEWLGQPEFARPPAETLAAALAEGVPTLIASLRNAQRL